MNYARSALDRRDIPIRDRICMPSGRCLCRGWFQAALLNYILKIQKSDDALFVINYRKSVYMPFGHQVFCVAHERTFAHMQSRARHQFAHRTIGYVAVNLPIATKVSVGEDTQQSALLIDYSGKTCAGARDGAYHRPN